VNKNELLIELHKADEEALVSTLAMLIEHQGDTALGAALVRVMDSHELKMLEEGTLRTILLALATFLPDVEESTDEN
jgi:putative AlgH/UPF0301 family transcriptional regulator